LPQTKINVASQFAAVMRVTVCHIPYCGQVHLLAVMHKDIKQPSCPKTSNVD